ncbi:MAG: PilZ domain-containing protein [Lachnospiraceae bacterium]|nr:PilZ domain-containing protein [Lachnospiraceae bacterium]
MAFNLKTLFGSGEERRRYPRYNVVGPGNIYVDNRPLSCLVIDISKGGVRLSTELAHGLTGVVPFDFMDNGEVIKGEAEIVYGMTSYDSEVYGCKLISITPEDYIEKKYERKRG